MLTCLLLKWFVGISKIILPPYEILYQYQYSLSPVMAIVSHFPSPLLSPSPKLPYAAPYISPENVFEQTEILSPASDIF